MFFHLRRTLFQARIAPLGQYAALAESLVGCDFPRINISDGFNVQRTVAQARSKDRGINGSYNFALPHGKSDCIGTCVAYDKILHPSLVYKIGQSHLLRAHAVRKNFEAGVNVAAPVNPRQENGRPARAANSLEDPSAPSNMNSGSVLLEQPAIDGIFHPHNLGNAVAHGIGHGY